MNPKSKKKVAKMADSPTRRTTAYGRDGLVAYTIDPASFPKSRVVYYDEKFVVINDLYPKATVHLLVLPREEKWNVQRGQEAFDDSEFLEDCRVMTQKVRHMAAEELRRKIGQYSASEKLRLEAMEADDIPDELPPGRDWEQEVMTGTHANPSMTHLHIHVLSKDMHSQSMRKTNHYQSFTTDFFIRLREYPLAEDDDRRDYGWFPRNMICWRCGRDFGNRMTSLKEHLEEEFKQWRGE